MKICLGLLLIACCSSMPLVSMMGSGGSSSGDASAEVVVEVMPADAHLRELIVSGNPEGDFFEKFVAEVQKDLADEVKHRIPKISEAVKVPYLSVEHFSHCVAEAAAVRETGENTFLLRQKSRDLIDAIMKWLPARDISYGSTEKRLADFGDGVPLCFEIAMSRDGVVVCIPNPYFDNQTGKTCVQLLHEDRPHWPKKVMLRPGASAEDAIDDAHAILLFQYIE